MSAILAATITGVCSIIAAALGLWGKDWLNRQKYAPVGPQKRQALTGNWEGVSHQEVGPDGGPIDVHLTGNLEFLRRGVKGSGEVRWSGPMIRVNVRGGFFDDRHLKLEYEAADRATLNFGSLILDLSPDNRILAGRLVGFGHAQNRLISGETVLQKKP